jgi:hypothetical protein
MKKQIKSRIDMIVDANTRLWEQMLTELKQIETEQKQLTPVRVRS